jgi:hypothetical protein
MSDASGQDEDAPVFKIKEEQKASPALEHHGTNDNSIDTHANGSAKSKDGNHSKHNARLIEIRMPHAGRHYYFDSSSARADFV